MSDQWARSGAVQFVLEAFYLDAELTTRDTIRRDTIERFHGPEMHRPLGRDRHGVAGGDGQIRRCPWG